MHVLGRGDKSTMNRFIESYQRRAREYLDTLQAVKRCNYLTAKEAEQIVANMQPKPLWNRTAWEGMMTNLGLPMQDEPRYNQEALYVTMQMICSDDAETLMNYLGMQDLNSGNREILFKLVYKLALNKLCDKDKMFNIREYFKL